MSNFTPAQRSDRPSEVNAAHGHLLSWITGKNDKNSKRSSRQPPSR